MASNVKPPVLVGVDGSPSGANALGYAADLASRRGNALRLVHVLLPPYRFEPYGVIAPPGPSRKEARLAVDSWLGGLVEEVRRQHRDLSAVQAVQIDGYPAAVLAEESRHAAVTVVGCRGVGGFTELLLGSTSSQLAAYGHGPVIVVRPPVVVEPGPEQRPHRVTGPVVACYDGSPAAKVALRFAADEAVLRETSLTVAHVYEHDEQAAKQLLIDAVQPWADDYPGPPIELRPIFGEHTGYALVEVSRKAALTVAGSRGRGGFAGLLLGSVSRTLVHHAYGPVAVVHATEHRAEHRKEEQ